MIVPESLNINDRQLIDQIIIGNKVLIALFLKQKCAKTFEYIRNTRLKGLDLDVNDLISDFYLFLQENNWEKLRTFRFESKLQTWVNLVASRYLLKKYEMELKENSMKGTPIEGIASFIDETHYCSVVRAELLEAIQNLKDKKEQQVLLLTLQGYDAVEIARNIGTSTSNVYTIKCRAIEKLRIRLND